MTYLQFHIFRSPSHTRGDEGLKLCIHNLIHTIKHISWYNFGQPHCVAIVAYGWLLGTRSKLRLQNMSIILTKGVI